MVVNGDGTINYPFSRFLKDKFDNVSTRELIFQSLRVLRRFLDAHGIELVTRAMQGTGRSLANGEVIRLTALCFRPLTELEAISDAKVVAIADIKPGKAPRTTAKAVEPNTARRRLEDIAGFLNYFQEVFLNPSIRHQNHRDNVKAETDTACRWLREAVTGTKQNHHAQIQSLPSKVYLEVVRAIFTRPEDLFTTKSGKLSRTLQRDRAMALVAAEGIRPGTLPNITIADFRPRSSHIVIKDRREEKDKPTSGTPQIKGGGSLKVNYASDTMLLIQPITVSAIQKYIDGERSKVLSRRLRNKSQGALFINEKGEPIKHRSSATSMFARLETRLQELGLLDVGSDPHFEGREHYEFYGYVLRHSAASFYVERKGDSERALDEMKSRFGWTHESKQPARYAARALSDKANVDLEEYNKKLLAEVQQKSALKPKAERS